METNDRRTNLEAVIGKAIGKELELTVRGLREFTFSFDGIDKAAEKRIISYFGPLADCNVSRVADEDDSFTCVFVNLK